MDEFILIDKIKNILNNKIIGDDSAPIKIGNKTYLFTNDILLEDEHFLDYFPANNLGWKAVSVNVSDIVASGGRPKYVLVSLLLPKNKTFLVEKIYQSIKKACQYYRCQVVGGNITKSKKLGIDIFMVGETTRFISRRGARIGDKVYLTGTLGDSKAGLELLLMKKNNYEPFEENLIETHLKPNININLGSFLTKNANASIDISDGLSSDVYHLANMSKVKIEIDSKKIPLSKELKLFCKKYGHNPINYSFIGGEDYQILYTKNLNKKVEIIKSFSIGKVVEGSGVFIDGKKLKNKSFNHFSSSAGPDLI